MTCQNYFRHIADLCSKIIELYLYPKVKINVLETTQCLIKLRMMKKSHFNWIVRSWGETLRIEPYHIRGILFLKGYIGGSRRRKNERSR